MRILYGLCGEGLGHATRSKVAIDHLLSRGHEVLVVASGQALPFCRRAFEGSSRVRVLAVEGLTMQCAGGAVDVGGTVEDVLRRLPLMLARGGEAWPEFDAFGPDHAVTDFDSLVWVYAQARSIPLISIGNHQVLTHCAHDERLFGRHAEGLRLFEALIRDKSAGCQHYIVTSFFYPPVRPELAPITTQVSPILRPAVLERTSGLADKRTSGLADFVLVYKTASLDAASLLRGLRALSDVQFVVYGLSPSDTRIHGYTDLSNVTPKPFAETAFLDDLARSRAVVASGGMSLIGEALAFGKPVYAVPIRGQYEQVLSAIYLEHLEYGAASELFDPEVLRLFLSRREHHVAAIRSRPQHDDNERFYAALDRLVG